MFVEPGWVTPPAVWDPTPRPCPNQSWGHHPPEHVLAMRIFCLKGASEDGAPTPEHVVDSAVPQHMQGTNGSLIPGTEAQLHDGACLSHIVASGALTASCNGRSEVRHPSRVQSHFVSEKPDISAQRAQHSTACCTLFYLTVCCRRWHAECAL